MDLPEQVGLTLGPGLTLGLGRVVGSLGEL